MKRRSPNSLANPAAAAPAAGPRGRTARAAGRVPVPRRGRRAGLRRQEPRPAQPRAVALRRRSPPGREGGENSPRRCARSSGSRRAANSVRCCSSRGWSGRWRHRRIAGCASAEVLCVRLGGRRRGTPAPRRDARDDDFDADGEAYGPFRTERDAWRAIGKARAGRPVLKVLGRERGEGRASGWVGRCRGACVGREPLALHDARCASRSRRGCGRGRSRVRSDCASRARGRNRAARRRSLAAPRHRGRHRRRCRAAAQPRPAAFDRTATGSSRAVSNAAARDVDAARIAQVRRCDDRRPPGCTRSPACPRHVSELLAAELTAPRDRGDARGSGRRRVRGAARTRLAPTCLEVAHREPRAARSRSRCHRRRRHDVSRIARDPMGGHLAPTSARRRRRRRAGLDPSHAIRRDAGEGRDRRPVSRPDRRAALRGPRRPALRIGHLRLAQTMPDVALDLGGDPPPSRLSPVGRRGAAEENLAAALLDALRLAVARRGRAAFADPMCGSGTFVIEAALIAAGSRPDCCVVTSGSTAGRGHDPRPRGGSSRGPNALSQKARRGRAHARSLPRLGPRPVGDPCRDREREPLPASATICRSNGARRPASLAPAPKPRPRAGEPSLRGASADEHARAHLRRTAREIARRELRAGTAACSRAIRRSGRRWAARVSQPRS